LGRLDPDRLHNEEVDYTPWRVYARRKVALLAYTLELNRRLRAGGSKIIALGAHPGFAATEIVNNSAVTKPKTAIGKWVRQRMERLIPSAAEATAPIIHAACAERVGGGDYCGPSGWLEIAGPAAKARVNALAFDENLAARLWSTSEALAGVFYLSSAGLHRSDPSHDRPLA
jgi:hypothetical protein